MGRDRLETLLTGDKLLLGVVHLRPLPGSPRHGGETVAQIAARARRDADALLEAGFDGYVLENFGDVPFFPRAVPSHVVGFMTRIACELPRREIFVAANVLRNDAAAALAVAAAAELDAIRVNVHTGAMVTDQGIVEGEAASTLRLRREIAPSVAILADVDVKHAAPFVHDSDLGEAARDAAYRGLADALIVTGKATGTPARLDDLRAVRDAVRDRPVLVGSGADEETVLSWLREAHGVIVGSAVKRDGQATNEVDPERARKFVTAASPVKRRE